MRKLSSCVLPVVFLAAFFFQACGQSSNPQIYRIATDATLIPMSFINDQNKIDGFEPELMQAIAKQAGIDFEMVNVEWAGVIGGVVTKKFDMAISSITILEERKEKVAFSIPYLKSGLAIVLRRDTEDIASIKDLQEKRLRVGAQRGTTAYFFLEKHSGLTPVAYEHYGHAVADMIKGEVDAVVGESTGTLYYKNHDNAVFKKIKMVGEIMTDESYGMVLPKEDLKLKQRVDLALKTLIENGTVETLHAKWELGLAAAVPEQQ